MSKTKPFTIPKDLVMKAYKLVKANAGGAGVDRQSLQDFDLCLKDNLYKRLRTGCHLGATFHRL